MTDDDQCLLVCLMLAAVILVIVPVDRIWSEIRYWFTRLCVSWGNWDPYYVYTPATIKFIRRTQNILGMG